VETTTDRVLELTLSFFFAVDLLMGLYVCDHRIWFWVKPDVVREMKCCVYDVGVCTHENVILCVCALPQTRTGLEVFFCRRPLITSL